MRTNVVYEGDCIQGLKKLPEKSVDCIITDPPYPINTNNGTNRFTEKGWFEGSQEDYSDKWYNWFEDICKELKRVLNEGRHFYCYVDEKNLFSLKPIIDKYFTFKKVIVWHKKYMGLGYHYRNIIEYVLMYSNGISKLQINDQPNFFKSPKDTIEGHPTVKPISMIKWIVKNSTLKEEIILDPFMGSGTTALACKQLNRRWVGFELSPEYCKIIEKRLSQKIITGFFDTQADSTSQSLNKD